MVSNVRAVRCLVSLGFCQLWYPPFPNNMALWRMDFLMEVELGFMQYEMPGS